MTTTNNKTKEEDLLDDAFEKTPQEVVDFISDPIFENILLGIKDALSLNDNQLSDLRLLSYELVLQTKSMEEAAMELISKKTYSNELASKILYAIDQEIISRVFSILSNIEAEEKEVSNEASEKTVSASIPADILAKLNQNLTKPTVTPPTSRDYSLNRPMPTGYKTPTADPYRERPNDDIK